ncbi:MAG: hypothetical protein K2M48_02970 [Clostridiales bacterium]|nr:hypothetical protein [Clostridiales bacterium]
MKRDRKLDQFLSVLVLLLYVVIIVIKWIMVYQSVPESAIMAVNIIGTIIQCLTICVVLYNALGWTGSIIIKILFIVIALFLIVSSVIVWVPAIREAFTQWNLPSIF